ncbi:MAG: nuclear transport factor 2 family protein [bacterium]
MVERFKAIFNVVGPQMADGVEALYAAELRFRDPITQIEGSAAMRGYLLHFAKTAAGATFRFTDTLIQPGTAAVFWTMTTAADGKRPGREIQGVSHLRVRERVYEERDYFDLGEVYDQVPVMNWFTGLVKSRLAP